MESALIISSTEKGFDFFSDILSAASITQISALRSCGEARRLILERDFDLLVVNAPLRDESGESLSRYIASKGVSQVILIVKNEYFDAVSAVCEGDGVLTISKPVNKTVFWSALMLAKSAQSRIKRIQNENARLIQKIEDIRIVDRAKLILVSCMNMSEKEAHRYIEKQAMDMRSTRREIAEGVLRTYEN
ncbi:MAG: ANTAR domain-containing protein [Oscillospiraceae bacterium]|nr:ANTAR domain-containing protein [Oscillospiraceae bacterium]